MTQERSIEELALELKEIARARRITIGTAESCTGGLIATAITAIPGSSEYFLGSVVSYANSVKASLLGVPEEILNTVGAVSGECACFMAQGAAKVLGSDLTVSVTGVAGPDGGSVDKPVGTVWFGVCSSSGAEAHVRYFTGGRAAVRTQTAVHALSMLISALTEVK